MPTNPDLIPRQYDPFTKPETAPIERVQPRDRLAVEGVVLSVRRRELQGGCAFEAELSDLTGTIVLRFLGRTSVAGVTVGRSLAAAGTAIRSHGDLVLLNPYVWLGEAATLESATPSIEATAEPELTNA